MIKRLVAILMFIFHMSVYAYADNEIIEQQIIQQACNKDTIFNSSFISIKLPVSVLLQNRVNPHVGFSLFSNETKNLTNSEICNFIERLFFKLYLLNNKKSELEYLKNTKIALKINNTDYSKSSFAKFHDILNGITMPSEFSINNDGKNFYISFIYGKNSLLELAFPASRELIFGLDKKELDQEVSALLSGNINDNNSIRMQSIVDASLLSEYKNGIYIKKGSFFHTSKLSNDAYYVQGDDKIYYPVLDSKFPLLSVSNILLGLTTQNPKVHIKHRMYGNFTPNFTIRLNKIFNCFDKDFNLYVGVQKLDNNQIQGVLVFHNYTYNYTHMLIVKIDQNDIDNIDNVILNADFYSNIPQHNIKI